MLESELQWIKKQTIRGLLLQGLLLVNVFASGLVLWKGISLLTNSESPIVVVLSESMEPAFARGDLLFLTNSAKEPFKVGDITVYKIPGQSIPIVHRIIETHDLPDSGTPDQRLMTKGDNNPADDISLYNGELFLQRKHIVGRVKGFIPYIGYATIVSDFPQLKYALLGITGLLVLVNKGE